jgi:hypothetical protein
MSAFVIRIALKMLNPWANDQPVISGRTAGFPDCCAMPRYEEVIIVTSMPAAAKVSPRI